MRYITISNVFTCIRIILTPFVIKGILLKEWKTTIILFFLAAITDAIDGVLARALNQKSRLGAILDPLADKFLLIGSFFALSYSSLQKLPAWFSYFILLRELLIVCGALFLLYFKKVASIKPTIYGKLTTLFQISFLFLIFLTEWLKHFTTFDFTFYFSYVLWFVTLFSIFSLFHYALIFFKSRFTLYR